MNFLSKLTQAITLIPFIIQGVENIFGRGNGKNKAEKIIDLFNFTSFFSYSRRVVEKNKFYRTYRVAFSLESWAI